MHHIVNIGILLALLRGDRLTAGMTAYVGWTLALGLHYHSRAQARWPTGWRRMAVDVGSLLAGGAVVALWWLSGGEL